MQKSALMIFIKNPILGQVKTRLAATIGNENALLIFTELLKNIHQQTQNLKVDKFLFYSNYIDKNDIWENEKFIKKIQDNSTDLGQRMYAAFEEIRKMGYEKCVIVGSDIYEVSTDILNQAFQELELSETVLGPTFDGGYYALGINFGKVRSDKFLEQIFLNKTWSHENVASEALDVIKKFSFQCNFLPTLNDIDTEEDLKKNPILYNIL